MAGNRELNEERMRLIGRRFADLSLVARVEPFPHEKPDRVVVAFEESYYPEEITASLEFRLRRDGEFNVQYIESWAGEQWVCRWDRHENTHNDRDHFHVPPAPRETNAVDADYPTNLDDALRLVLDTIQNRINDLWSSVNDPVFPGEYEFEGEYGAAYLDS